MANEDEGEATSLVVRDLRVEEAWLDFNGHMNMAYYLVLFDRSIDRLIDAVGLSTAPDDRPTLFAAEADLRYLREVRADHVLSCETEVEGVEEKRLRTVQTLRHADGTVAATCRNLHLHVRRDGPHPRVGPFEPATLERLRRLTGTNEGAPGG